jgi:hypothetical protein
MIKYNARAQVRAQVRARVRVHPYHSLSLSMMRVKMGKIRVALLVTLASLVRCLVQQSGRKEGRKKGSP